MVLYGPDLKLLCRMKRVQEDLNGYVLIFNGAARYCSGYFSTDVERARDSSLSPVRLGLSADMLTASLSRMIDLGLLERPASGPVYRVTYDGWYARQVRIREVVRLIVTNVLFPSLVAFLTTLFTLLLA